VKLHILLGTKIESKNEEIELILTKLHQRPVRQISYGGLFEPGEFYITIRGHLLKIMVPRLLKGT